ncbi:integrase catalytic domain-containing protein [Trichonephila clavipes]|nr:integrase catalytic domain-containing protein [Trichonephila clavipes]
MWEASVKLTKQHLLKTLKAAVLNFEDLDTILCQIEACINSRPLYPLSSDPKDHQVLTPGHFLIECPLLDLPDHSLTNQSLSIHSRWSLLRNLKRMFWSRWQLFYLNTLQSRTKWINGRTHQKIQPFQHQVDRKWILLTEYQSKDLKCGLTRPVSS